MLRLEGIKSIICMDDEVLEDILMSGEATETPQPRCFRLSDKIIKTIHQADVKHQAADTLLEIEAPALAQNSKTRME